MIEQGLRVAFVGLALGALTACGGSDSSGSGTGTLTLAITDAPVDMATAIRVQFDGVTLKPNGGSQASYAFAGPITVDLKELTDGATQIIFDERIPVGEYTWMKLDVNAECDGVMDSYVTLESGGMHDLRVPPDRLKLGNHFTIVEGGSTSLIIEWNLRMGLSDPVGLVDPSGGSCLNLQPSLKVTDVTQYGAIAGKVTADLTGGECTSDANTGDGNVVYIYAGAGIVPDDIDGTAPDPLTTADVRLNDGSGSQEYMATYLSPGEYTAALTCQAADDAPETEDDIAFIDSKNATVVDDQTTIVDFN